MIVVRDLTKRFKCYSSPADRLKEIVLRRAYHRIHTALEAVSFTIKDGEALGIIGQNGSGKSTLLKILAGVLLPDAGTIHIDGRLTGLLELGTGFHGDFTGRMNIRHNAALLGMSRDEIEAKMEAMTAFAELGPYIDEPVKTYSSGMVMRLAFSVAIHADPEVFVVDEALAVGDAYFQNKCMERIRAHRARGGSLIFVSHDMAAVQRLCDQVLLMDRGRALDMGNPEEMIRAYNILLARKGAGKETVHVEAAPQGHRTAYGTLKVRVTGVHLVVEGVRGAHVVPSGGACTVEVAVEAEETVDELTVGMLIRDRFGQDVFGTNTYHLGKSLALQRHEGALVRFHFDEWNIGPGKYTLTVAVHRAEVHYRGCYQWVDNALSFETVPSGDYHFVGLARLKPRLECVPAQESYGPAGPHDHGLFEGRSSLRSRKAPL